MDDLISIVIPIYKVEQYINKCIDSVINQTYTNLEIILVNDGTPDNCGKICDDYARRDNRIKVIHKENGGLSDARNAGIEIARGNYISFIDSDDYVEPNYIELLYNSIKKEGSDICIGSHKAIYENGTVLEKATGEKSILAPKEVLRRILYDDGIDLSAWAKLYKMELFKEIRYPKGRVFEDAATTYKLIDKSDKISINSTSTYNYIIRNNSITNKEFSESKMDLITSTEEMCMYIKNKYPDLEKACNRREMYAYLSTLTQLTKAANPDEKYIDKLMNYINKNRKKLLQDEMIPKRDRMALNLTKFGFKFFKFGWNVYALITGRK